MEAILKVSNRITVLLFWFFFRTTTSSESLCVFGPEHTIQAEFLESPFKNCEAAYVETMGLETWTAVS